MNSRDDHFIERYVECQSALYRFIATLVPNRADAEALFQEAARDRVEIMPASQPVVVDGNLSEWGRQTMFHSRALAE
jgi:hypothetical protein